MECACGLNHAEDVRIKVDKTLLERKTTMRKFAVELSSPTSVDIAITKKCNHRCVHCYNVWRTDSDNSDVCKVLTDEQIRTITDELVKNDIWRATLTGGEPLAELDVLYKLILSLKKHGISLGMNTNLSLMTEEIARRLTAELQWDNILLTSLPGLIPEICDRITQVPGSYNRIVKGIDVCNKYNIPVGINIVISKNNLLELERLYDFVKKHNVDYVSITRAIAPLYDQNNPAFFLNEKEITYIADVLEQVHTRFNINVGSVTPFPLCILKDISKYQDIVSASCAAGISRCSIDAITGDITACTHEERSYGNIYTDGLKAAWENMYEWRQGLLVNEECRDCEMLAFCGGECRMIAGTEANVKYHLDKNAQIKYTPYAPVDPISDDTVFRISKNVRYRREPFGGILRCAENECYVTETIILLYEKIKGKDIIKVCDFLEFCEENDFLYDAIVELEKMKILQRIKE